MEKGHEKPSRQEFKACFSMMNDEKMTLPIIPRTPEAFLYEAMSHKGCVLLGALGKGAEMRLQNRLSFFSFPFLFFSYLCVETTFNLAVVKVKKKKGKSNR